MSTTVFSFEYSSDKIDKQKLIAVLKAHGVKKVTVEEKYTDDDLDQLIEEGRKDLKEGKTFSITSKNVWDLIK